MLAGSLLICGSWQALSAAAEAQNFPPVARASANSDTVFPGETVDFDGSASFDPDDGPSPLQLSWDFGDGNSAAGAEASHRYAAPGVYSALLTAKDGDRQSVASVTVHVLEPLSPGSPSQSSPLFLDVPRSRIWGANADAGSVTIVDTATRSVIREVKTCGEPRALAGSADGEYVFVTCRDDGTVAVLNAQSMHVERAMRVGRYPYGIAVVPDQGTVLVALEGADEVVALSADGSSEIARWPVVDGPRALAISHDGRTAYVSHFLTRGDVGQITVLDLANASVAGVIGLAENPGPDLATGGRGFPNLLGALAISPSGRQLWVGGLKANTGRGSYLNGQPFPFTNRLRALLAPIGLPAQSDDIDRRIDANDTDSVAAIRFSRTGRYAFLAHPGAGRISIYDMSSARDFVSSANAAAFPAEARLDVGHLPNGLALSSDDRTLYVLAELSRELVVIDVSDVTTPAEVSRIPLCDEPLSPEVALGKRLFHRSRDPIHSQDNYIACASCHPGGAMDGRSWDFSQFGEGLRNTIDLRGRAGMAHGPIHWSANFDEIQDFENDIVHGFGGTGLADDGSPPNPPLAREKNAGRSQELDALAAYLTSLATGPVSPFRDSSGAITEAARRGRATFEDSTVGCSNCHRAPRFTDSTLTEDPTHFVLHNVGTLGPASGKRLGGSLTGLDTPSLIGLWDSAPYLHDGSAATVRAVIVDRNRGDQHGVTSHLSTAELGDLEAYLLQIDGFPDRVPTARTTTFSASSCQAAPLPQDGSWAWLLTTLALSWLHRRKP